MKLYLIFFAISLMFSGCAGVKLTPQQTEFLAKVKKQPLTVTVTDSDIEAVWQRGYQFITKYSFMKVQIANDNQVETYGATPGGYTFKYAYSMTKFKIGNDWEVTVNCASNNPFSKGYARENAQQMIHYMLTSEIEPTLLHSPTNHPTYNAGRYE